MAGDIPLIVASFYNMAFDEVLLDVLKKINYFQITK